MDNENKSQPPTRVGKTWFLERGDGKVFACEEREAWNTLKNRGNWQRGDFKIIGVSDGKQYVESIKKATADKQIVDAKIAEKSSEMTRYLNTLDKFKFEQLLDDGDEKVVKVKGIIDGLKKDIAELNSQFSKGYQDIVDRAFKEELERAKGHIEMPSNQDIFTPKGDREVIMRNMPR